jgi:hypothetical protein
MSGLPVIHPELRSGLGKHPRNRLSRNKCSSFSSCLAKDQLQASRD